MEEEVEPKEVLPSEVPETPISMRSARGVESDLGGEVGEKRRRRDGGRRKGGGGGDGDGDGWRGRRSESILELERGRSKEEEMPASRDWNGLA